MRLRPALPPLAAVSALAGAGCGAAAVHAPGHHVRAAVRPLTVISVSFSSASRGWLLAGPPTRGLRRLMTSADGGRHWQVVPALPARTGGIGTVTFADARNGWLYRPDLWATHDAGRSWHRIRLPGGQVQSVTAGAGRVLASVGTCTGDGRACSFRIWTAPAGADSWRPVPGAAGGSRAPAPQVVLSGSRGFAFTTWIDPPAGHLLAGPADGSRRWRPVPDPCRGSWSAAVAARHGGQLVLLVCGSEPGAGQQRKTAYVSRTGGRSWHRVANPPSGGYVSGASTAGTGPVYLSGGRMNIFISPDFGRSWRCSRSLSAAAGLAEAGASLAATAITATGAVAIQYLVTRRQLWLSHDGGRRWTPVTVP